MYSRSRDQRWPEILLRFPSCEGTERRKAHSRCMARKRARRAFRRSIAALCRRRCLRLASGRACVHNAHMRCAVIASSSRTGRSTRGAEPREPPGARATFVRARRVAASRFVDQTSLEDALSKQDCTQCSRSSTHGEKQSRKCEYRPNMNIVLAARAPSADQNLNEAPKTGPESCTSHTKPLRL